MIELTGINYSSVLVVWLLYISLGAWWYSPAGFSKKWTKYAGINIMKTPTQQANRIILFVALSALVQAFSLAIILNSIEVTSLVDGIVAELVIWLGFTAATTVGMTLYSQQSWKFLWLNSSYFLIIMAIESAILSLWR
ncbi:MAG: DUF1761 domain-containing protein [Candidatus Saccharimonadales bacterium]